ncbi:hypothetical protein GCM10010304_76270 [Streptomyces roseoviolaceus]
MSALGAKVRRGDLQDLERLKEAAADPDGVIHVAHRQDLLPSGGMDAVAAAELPSMLAYGEALAGTGKPLVTAGSMGLPGNLERPATEEDPALPAGEEHKGTLRIRNVVERTVVDLAEQGVRSSVVRIANIAHSTTDRAGFLPTLIALVKERGRPAGAADRSCLPIAGDSAPAKAAVTEFIESIGYSVVDAGTLADSWRQAPGTPVWGTPCGPYSNEKGQPVGEDAIRAALATATR